MEAPLIEFYRELVEHPGPAVLVTVAAVKGSSPGKPGFKMLIYADGSTVGSVGGGGFEQAVIADALKLLHRGSPELIVYELTEQATGMWCGGEVTVLLEPFGPPATLWIFGYGHVGREVQALVQPLMFKPIVVNDNAPDAGEWFTMDWVALEPFPEVASGDFVLLATMDAQIELKLLARLSASQPRYLGVIGSHTKAAKLKEQLSAQGVAVAQLKLHIPVGIDIGAQDPREIAISIAAELIKERNA